MARYWVPFVALWVGATAAHASPTAKQELQAALAKTPNLDHGAELFQSCAACHGASGGGSAEGDVPRIAGQHSTVIVRQLVDYRHEARWDIRMEHYAGRKLLEDPQSIADVAAYISQLGGEQPRNVGNGELVQHGAAVYAAKCAECHGAMGEGSGTDRVPRLAGQHYSYLLRQMYDAVDGRRPNFSRSHVRLLAKLERDDFVGIADFLARSEWAGPVPPVTHVR
ncbi:MAG TPA: c-type cytochrome [Steroidobacteraceae bacterium]|jgi:cytochrome c553|nr:c-type cytochrome [Steroidobacteraceae bacterium]